MNKWLVLIFILVVALGFRLGIVNWGYHDDLYSNTAWSEWIYLNGPNGFYENPVWVYSWPTQPPLISLLYGSNYWLYARVSGRIDDLAQLIPAMSSFNEWFKDGYYSETPLKVGAMMTMKWWAIAADLVVAIVIYLVALRVAKVRYPWVWSMVWLISPFTWYVSSLWGQYDGLSYLFLLLSFYGLVYRKFSLAAILFFVSLGVKPTGLIFLPYFAWIYFRQKPPWKSVVISLISVSGLFWFTTQLFSDRPIHQFIEQVLIPKIFFKTDFRLTTNAFNWWRIWTSGVAQSQDWLFLGVSAKYWGYLLFGLANGLAIYLWRRVTILNVTKAMVLIGGASFLFMTNMLDRYFYTTVAALLIVAIFERRYLWAWIILSLTFWLNLYNQWWFPSQLEGLKQVMVWQNGLMTQIVSLINVIIFGWIVIDFWRGKSKSTATP